MSNINFDSVVPTENGIFYSLGCLDIEVIYTGLETQNIFFTGIDSNNRVYVGAYYDVTHSEFLAYLSEIIIHHNNMDVEKYNV